MLNPVETIARQFSPQIPIAAVQAFGQGNINQTFLVTLALAAPPLGTLAAPPKVPVDRHFILQRINTQVFRQPHLVMQNMRRVSDHVHDRLQRWDGPPDRSWQMPRVLLTQDGQDHWIEPDGSFWRAISFIDQAHSFDTVQHHDHAKEVGYALGNFHHLISDLPAEHLADTLPGFHITPDYLHQYETVLAEQTLANIPEVSYSLQFVQERHAWASVLEQAKAEGKLQLRPMHGDPKINNILVDKATGKAVSIIDLDTVKPGLVHYDIGDCLRSGCNPLGEETDQWEQVRFEPDLCQAILQGYCSVASQFLTDQDYAYLYDAIRLIAFELGLRFLTDYLAGNVYFKVNHPTHNLQRAIGQFKLTESIEAQETTLRQIIQDLQRSC